MSDLRATILNVNDSPSTQYLVSRILRGEGYRIIEAGTGLEAVEKARTELPSLVVLDIKLPDIDGYEVCRRLKSDPLTSRIPVLATSATFVTAQSRSHGLDSGADAYLTQPFESLELVALVEALLRGKHHEAEARAKADALSEADHRKDEFLAMLAHELRNPLGAIVAAAAMLDEDSVAKDHRHRLTATIQRQARHLATMVDDLLDVSRITHGKISLKTRVIDARHSVEGVAHGMLHVFQRKGQELEVTLPKDDQPVWIDADPTRVEQILQNLLNNAAKYSDSGGKICLSLERHEGSARMSVKDCGVGIAKENLPKLFDLFYQVDSTLARSVSGLGIGLTMVQRLVMLHGGTVRAESEGLGKGTEMIVDLPLSGPPVRAEDPGLAARPSVSKRDGGPVRILLVDDNAESLEIFQMALSSAGHVVDIAHDGQEGLELARGGEYDAAVVDIGLPLLDGYQVAQGVVAALGKKRPALIALTGYGRPEDRERAIGSGFDAHLVKPVDLDVLEKTLSNVLGRASDSRP
jgi:signal transduction histidine kinase